jgi:hypothetical protein
MESLQVYSNKPRKSNKFDELSLYYEGVYYFTKEIRKSNTREKKPFEIQGVYYQGKWYQDTFYITEQFKNFLLNNI